MPGSSRFLVLAAAAAALLPELRAQAPDHVCLLQVREDVRVPLASRAASNGTAKASRRTGWRVRRGRRKEAPAQRLLGAAPAKGDLQKEGPPKAAAAAELDQRKSDICSITFYGDGDFHGWTTKFNMGRYSLAAAMSHGFQGDDASSFKIRGYGNCRATLYGGPNFQFYPWYADFGPGDWDVDSAMEHGFVNDNVNSFYLYLVATSTSSTTTSLTTTSKTQSSTSVSTVSVTSTSRTTVSKTSSTTATSATVYTVTTTTSSTSRTATTTTTISTTVTTWTYTTTTKTYTSTSRTHTSTSRSTTTHTDTTTSETTVTRTTTTSTTTSTRTTKTSTTYTTRTFSTLTWTTRTRSTLTSTVTTTTSTTTSATTTSTSSSTTTHTTGTTVTATTLTTSTTTLTVTTTTTATTTTSTTTVTVTTGTSITTSTTHTTTSVTYTTGTTTSSTTSTTSETTSTTTASTATSSTTTSTHSTTTSSATDPTFRIRNGHFETNQATMTYEYACSIPGWDVWPSPIDGETTCPAIVRTAQEDDEEFGATDSADGLYFVALRRAGCAVSQDIPGHNIGEPYMVQFFTASRGLVGGDPVLRVTIEPVPMLANLMATNHTVHSKMDEHLIPVSGPLMKFHTIPYYAMAAGVRIKFENFSPNYYATVYIDGVASSDPPPARATCADLLVEGKVWDQDMKGFDLLYYTSGQMRWIGCNNQGCRPESFYCRDGGGDGSSDLEFGTIDNTPLRALLGSVYPPDAMGCATNATPNGISNAMDREADVNQLCAQLGYTHGELVVSSTVNVCPEVQWYAPGETWTSDFASSGGFGKEFRCFATSTSSTSSTSTTTTSMTTTATSETASATSTTTATTFTSSATATATTATTGSGTTTSVTIYTTTSTATDPTFRIMNGGFEEGSETSTFEYNCSIPWWTAEPGTANGVSFCPIFVKTGRSADEEFGGTNAAYGEYLLALRRNGASVTQKVYRHQLGAKHRIEFWVASRGNMNTDPVLRLSIGGNPQDFTVSSREMTYHYIDYPGQSKVADIKFENASPEPLATLFIDSVIVSRPPPAQPQCADLLYEGFVWGKDGRGIDVGNYTQGTLKFIGCIGVGCEKETFYCNDVDGNLEFGTSGTGALRALLGSVLPATDSVSCASTGVEAGVANAMDQIADVHRLCQQLGYAAGELLLANGAWDTCPEIHFDEAGGMWTSDFVGSAGYGQQFRCTATSATTSVSGTTATVSETTTTASTTSMTGVTFTASTDTASTATTGTATATITASTATTHTTATATTTVTDPTFQIKNGGFEAGSTASAYEYNCEVPYWTTTPSFIDGVYICPLFVLGGRPEDEEFGGSDAADGQYYLGLRRQGAAIQQAVYRHEPGGQYRLEWHMAKRGVAEDPVVRLSMNGVTVGDYTVTSRTMTYTYYDYSSSGNLVEIKFENVSPNPYSTLFLDHIDSHKFPLTPAACSQLVTEASMWGQDSKGIDLTLYTNGTLKWIGCAASQGCDPSTFYCYDYTYLGGGLRFGTTSDQPLRALLGSYPSTSDPTCATAQEPKAMCNAPDKIADVKALCEQLGYPEYVLEEAGTSNVCPEVSYDTSGDVWTSDFVGSAGYGLRYHCLFTTTTSTVSTLTNTTSTTTTRTTMTTSPVTLF